eukprot:4036323-Pyramimonas_sp.AAC.1
MKLSGPEGGCSAKQTTLGEIAVARARARAVPQTVHEEEVGEDLQRLKRAIWKAKLGKSTPAWSCPIELLR